MTETFKYQLMIKYSAVIAALSFFIFGLPMPVGAEQTFSHADIRITSESSGDTWNIGSLVGDKAITNGVLTFEAKGFRQDDPENSKRQVMAMYDADQPTLFDNRGYFMHFRKRVDVPQLSNQPGIQFKGAIDCDWFEPEANFATEPWNPNTKYKFILGWDQDGATLTVENETGGSWSGSVGYTYPFLAASQEVAFGSAGLASSSAFPAEPGLEYTNISLTVNVTEEPDTLGGYPLCEESFRLDPGIREDEPGTDSGDPYDDPNNPYDQCACEPIDGINSLPCEDPKAGKDEFKLTDPPFRISVRTNDVGFPTGLKLKPLWTFDRIAGAFWDKEEADESSPAIDLKLSPNNVTKGGEMNVTIAPQHFRTTVRNLYQNWCVTRGDTGATKSYNEIIAGGQPAQTYGSLSWENLGCCSPLTRAVKTDADNDGMDDEWERTHFLGRTVNGVVVTEANINEVVLPDDDLDHDGYFARKFVSKEKRPITVAPALIDHLGRAYYPGDGDAKLTNVEEFILGTDPMDGDSDNDGWGDEMDYMGIGATTFTFPVELAPGPNGYYLVTAMAAGINSTGDVAIAARTKKFEVSVGENLEVDLSSTQDNLVIDEQFPGGFVKLDVQVTSGEVEPEDLYFEWFFDGQPVCDLENYSHFCQMGRDSIELGGAGDGNRLIDLPGLNGQVANLNPGTPYLFTVRVTDPATRRSADASLYLPIAQAFHLTTACSESAGDSVGLPTDTGAATTICVEEFQAGKPAAVNLTNANWQWSVDGLADQQQSGVGKTTYSISGSEINSGQPKLMVEIYDVAAGGLLARATRDFSTVGPSVAITEPSQESYGGGRGTDLRMVRGQPGQTIRFVAAARDFPADGEVSFSWQAGGQQSSGVAATTFEYLIPADAPVGQDIPVQVQAQTRSAAGQTLLASDQVTLLISAGSGAVSFGEKIRAGLATVANFIPENYRLAVSIVVTGGLIAGIAWLVMKFSKYGTL